MIHSLKGAVSAPTQYQKAMKEVNLAGVDRIEMKWMTNLKP